MEDKKPFGIFPRQATLLEIVRDSKYTGIEEVFMIGPIGSSKTYAMAYCDINIAYQFANSIIPVGRKDLSEAQIGTWTEYIRVLGDMGLVHGIDYTTRQAPNDLRIKFKNDSIIQFVGMNKSRDPDFAKLKITATSASVDEVDDVDQGGYETLQSRTGRRNVNGAPRVMKSACNPNDKWTKRVIYLPWLKREGKRLEGMTNEEWNAIEPLDPKIEVIQFDMEDSPLYPTGYYDRFVGRSIAWRQRFLLNNWNYVDDENSLFKSRTMDMLTVNKLKRGERYIGVDPQAGGKDHAAIVLWEDDTIVDAELYTRDELEKLATGDERDPMNYGAVLGRLTRQMMKRERVGYLNVGGDVIGIGQGWLTDMLSHGMKVRQFVSGASPYRTQAEDEKNYHPPYFHLRDQMYVLWSMALQSGQVFFYGGMPHLATLKKELLFHESSDTEKVQRVTPKDDIKALLGGSPDIADAAMIGFYVRHISTVVFEQTQGIASVGQTYDDVLYGKNDF